MGTEQKFLLKKKLRDEERAIARRRAKFKLYMTELSYGMVAFALVITMIILMAWVSHDRRQRWPQLEPAILKQRQDERRREHLIWLQSVEETIKKQDQKFNQAQENSSDEK